MCSRTSKIIGSNKDIFREWIESFSGFLEYTEPKAGAMAFVKYNAEIPSIELAERVLKNQNVLIVPGAHLGLEGFIRLNLGPQQDKLVTALELVKTELEAVRAEMNP